MEFEWNENKNRANFKKHGVRFETATLVFADPFLVSVLDRRFDEIETRWHSLGMIETTILYVAHTVSESENGEETFRIISARKATSNEEREYYARR